MRILKDTDVDAALGARRRSQDRDRALRAGAPCDLLLNPHRFAGGGGGGGFDPESISGLLLWLDADASSTLVLSGSSVDSWADRSASGGGRTFTQSTGANKPTRNTTDFSGRVCVDFGNQERRWLTTASAVTITANSTVFMVFFWRSTSATYSSLCLQNGTSTNAVQGAAGTPYWIAFTSASGGARLQTAFNGGNEVVNTPTGHIAEGAKGLSTVKIASSIPSSTIRTDRVSRTVSTTGTSAPSSNSVNTVGVTDSLYTSNGCLAEMLVYNSQLSSTDTDSVETYLRDKWGTP